MDPQARLIGELQARLVDEDDMYVRWVQVNGRDVWHIIVAEHTLEVGMTVVTMCVAKGPVTALMPLGEQPTIDDKVCPVGLQRLSEALQTISNERMAEWRKRLQEDALRRAEKSEQKHPL